MSYPEIIIEVAASEGDVHGEPVTYLYARESIVDGYRTTMYGNTSRPMLMVYNDDEGCSHVARQLYSDVRPFDEELWLRAGSIASVGVYSDEERRKMIAMVRAQESGAAS